jgi:2-hydroxychromene-2-carboxylate isomerase
MAQAAATQDAIVREVAFYFDYRSPYSYLARTQLPRLVAAHGVTLRDMPFDVLGLMKLVGNRPTTVECEAKGRYARNDLARWAARYGVGLQRNPRMRSFDFPLLSRVTLVAIAQGKGAASVAAIFAAVWNGTDDLSDKTVLSGLLDRLGLAGEAVLEQASSQAVMDQLTEGTQQAAARGVFGAPTMFVGDDMFFGNDRLDFVAEALSAAHKAA